MAEEDIPYPFNLYPDSGRLQSPAEPAGKVGPFSGLIRKVTGLFGPKEPRTSRTGVISDSDSLRGLLQNLFATEVSADRRTVATRAWKMYDSDSRIASGIDGLVSDAFIADNDGLPFKVVFAQDNDITKELGDWFYGLRFHRVLQPLTVLALIEGNSFAEPVVDWDANSIVEVRKLYSFKEGYRINRVERGGRLLGFNQFDLNSYKRVATFAPWQVLHLRWNWLTGLYGRSLLHSEQTNWKRLDDAETDMSIARRVRAFLKFIHYHRDKSFEELEEIARRRKRSKDLGTLGVESDIYTSADKIDSVDPRNDALRNISDLEYREQKLFAAVRRPRALTAGYGRYVNRATLDRQTIHYLPTLHDLNEMGTDAIVELVNLQIVIKHNTLPKLVPFEVKWTDKTGEKLLEKTQRMALMVGSELIDRRTASEELGYLSSLPEKGKGVSGHAKIVAEELGRLTGGNGSLSEEEIERIVEEVLFQVTERLPSSPYEGDFNKLTIEN